MEKVEDKLSLVHLRLKLVENDDSAAAYEAESIDFNEEMNWEKICVIKIDKIRKEYEYDFFSKYKAFNIIPPSLYDKDEKERTSLLETKYKDYGYGAWSMRIHRWIKTIIEQDNYPNKYPMDVQV